MAGFRLPEHWRIFFAAPLLALGLALLLQSPLAAIEAPDAWAPAQPPPRSPCGNHTLAFFDFRVDELGPGRVPLKTYLHPVSGSFSCGRTVAVMGGSGSGKSTLLSALLGRRSGTSGQRVWGGQRASAAALAAHVSFVPQADDVHLGLSARENLWVAAALHHGVVGAAERAAAALAVLGIARPDVADKRVGHPTDTLPHISGGQKKRVNIGVELVAGRSALWLDEPTSGLDSSLSHSLAASLREHAHSGAAVVAVVHSPSVATFRLFDDLVLFAAQGHAAYVGPAHRAVAYFAARGWAGAWAGANPPGAAANPADWLIDVASGTVPRDVGTLGRSPHERLAELWEEECSAARGALGRGARAPAPAPATAPATARIDAHGTAAVSGSAATQAAAPEAEAENFCAPLVAEVAAARAAPPPAGSAGALAQSARASFRVLFHFLPLLWRSARLLEWLPSLLLSAGMGAVIGFVWWYLAPSRGAGLAALGALSGSFFPWQPRFLRVYPPCSSWAWSGSPACCSASAQMACLCLPSSSPSLWWAPPSAWARSAFFWPAWW